VSDRGPLEVAVAVAETDGHEESREVAQVTADSGSEPAPDSFAADDEPPPARRFGPASSAGPDRGGNGEGEEVATPSSPGAAEDDLTDPAAAGVARERGRSGVVVLAVALISLAIAAAVWSLGWSCGSAPDRAPSVAPAAP
jgi:hypothetical protein